MKCLVHLLSHISHQTGVLIRVDIIQGQHPITTQQVVLDQLKPAAVVSLEMAVEHAVVLKDKL